MNYEELLETRDVRKTTKVRLPYGYFYKRLIDGKYSNFVEFHDEIADDITFSCDTLSAQQFHEFHPMGGVSAIMRSPTFSVNFCEAFPLAFSAVTVKVSSQAWSILPLNTPSLSESFSPAGKLLAVNFMGRSPDTGNR